MLPVYKPLGDDDPVEDADAAFKRLSEDPLFKELGSFLLRMFVLNCL